MDPAEFDFFLKTPAIRFLLVKKLKRREYFQQYFELRNANGEFGRSYDELRINAKKFFEYARKTRSTFDYILEIVKAKLRKHTKFRYVCFDKKKTFSFYLL